MTKKSALKILKSTNNGLQRVLGIDGRHPYKEQVPDGRVEYRVAPRKNGKIYYFNFELAKDMGLIDDHAPAHLTPEMEANLLETFSLQVINEYDLIHGHSLKPHDIRAESYMATRYLQLQHRCKKGTTSGDGRSIWNGHFQGKNCTWDVSSCGTGATRLSPATQQYNRLFKTGDPSISYGCGLADLEDGLGAAVLSEIFHRQGIATERTLLLIEYPKGLSINVRAHPNLLRPSHFFGLMRQKNWLMLEKALGVYFAREINNGMFDFNGKGPIFNDPHWVDKFLKIQARRFGAMAARFESDYIFCWLDWDGDNILMDGGIIDFGSIRQFGLFHHQYRYDDVERWSTNLLEQRLKAREIVQTFAQMVYSLKSKKLLPLKQFENHWSCKKFDEEFHQTSLELAAIKAGFYPQESKWLARMHRKKLSVFFQSMRYFESKLTHGPSKRTADGMNRPAIYSVEKLFSQLPLHLALEGSVGEEDFKTIIWTGIGSKVDFETWGDRDRKQYKNLLKSYQDLLRMVAQHRNQKVEEVLLEIYKDKNSGSNFGRLTGDSLIFVISKIMSTTKNCSHDERFSLVKEFLNFQISGEDGKSFLWEKLKKSIKNIIEDNINGI